MWWWWWRGLTSLTSIMGNLSSGIMGDVFTSVGKAMQDEQGLIHVLCFHDNQPTPMTSCCYDRPWVLTVCVCVFISVSYPNFLLWFVSQSHFLMNCFNVVCVLPLSPQTDSRPVYLCSASNLDVSVNSHPTASSLQDKENPPVTKKKRNLQNQFKEDSYLFSGRKEDEIWWSHDS